jgi:hypothetical protein
MHSNFLLQFLHLFKKRSSLFFILAGCTCKAEALSCFGSDTAGSTRKEAILYLENIPALEASPYWPGIKPELFLENIKDNINNPLNLNEGNNTNFCGYAALSYLVLHDDPLEYAKFMIRVFREGRASFNRVLFKPTAAVRKVAGTLRYKGALDIRPADQLWFLSLADHFKGYLNMFNRQYDQGDEDSFWAAVNFGKFNRMVKKLLHYHVLAKGSDLFGPSISDIYSYLSGLMQSGITVLFVNNTILHKKNYDLLNADVPTHYIILLKLDKTPDGLINIVYWDYGFRTLRQLTPSILKKIIFGISHCTKPTDYAQ